MLILYKLMNWYKKLNSFLAYNNDDLEHQNGIKLLFLKT